MVRFILKRITFALITIWAVATLTFILMHNLPGEPFSAKKAVPTQIRNNLNIKYGLDKPLLTQYIIYMGNLLEGDFGLSMVYANRSVSSIISSGIKVSADLGIRALIIALTVGITLGIFSASYYKRFPDYLSLTVAILGVSIPGFAFGALVQYFLCYKLSILLRSFFGQEFRLLPVTGWDGFVYTIAPSIALSFGAVGIIVRMMRNSMLDVMNRNYILAARAKGLSEKEIVVKHALRNAILPVMAALGPVITSIILGSFVIENIFSIPGLGRYFVTSVQAKDYTMIMGLSVFTAFVAVAVNTALDILYSFIDPRVRIIKQ